MENQINIEELTKRAEQGDAAAIRELADCYYDGVGVEENYDKALELYLKLADQNDAKFGRIGFCYCQLDDYTNAVKW